MLSICITIKNRSSVKTEHGLLTLFPDCIKSLNKCLPLIDDVELIIADWKSEDLPIKEWIDETLSEHIPVHLITIDSFGFSKGKGLNIAADATNGNNIFFCDTDMILNKTALNRGIEESRKGNVFYPKVKYQTEYNGKLIIHEGGGNVFMNKRVFYSVGGWDELWSWGFEDTKMVEKLKRADVKIITDEDVTLLHQWHPQNKEFKNKHSMGNDPEVERMRVDTLNKEKELERLLRKEVIMEINNPNVTHHLLNSNKSRSIRR